MSASVDSSTTLSRLLESRGAVAGLYLVLTIGMTFPLVLHMGSSVPAGSGDIWQNYWNFWWWKKCLLELQQSPYHSELLFHPSGADVIFHTHSVFNMIVAMPASVIWGPGAAYNFCVLLALWLSGWGGYLLVKELTGDVRGAFLGGLVFAYFPQHIEQTLEHLNLFSTQFIPLTLLYFFRLSRRGGRRNIAGFAVCFALNALCSWHLGLKLILTLAPLAGLAVFRMFRMFPKTRPIGLFVRDLAIAAGVSAVILLPAVFPLLSELASGATYFDKRLVDRGIDASYLFTPFFEHPLWGSLTVDAYLDRAYQASGFICHLGFIPAGLAAWALVRRKKGAGYWAFFTAATLVLALGAHPFWDGKLYDGITLPFALLEFLPGLVYLRVANRFLILTSLGVAILVGYGWTALRKPGDLKFALLGGLIFLEYLWAPYPIQEVPISPLYSRLQESGRKGAILDIPFQQRNRTVPNLLAQTVHGRPIADGYMSTIPPQVLEAIQAEPALNDLAGVPKLERPIDRERLLALGFDTVVLHKDRAESYAKQRLDEVERRDLLGRKSALRLGGIPDGTMRRIRTELTQLCGEPQWEDERIAVFDLRRGTSSPAR